jgi:hypothetical protein
MDCFRIRSLSFGGRVPEPVVRRAFARPLSRNDDAVKRVRHNNPSGKSPRSRKNLSSSLCEKYSALPGYPIHFRTNPSRPMRGALRTSRHARWDAVDVELAKDDRRHSRTAKSCGPDAPMAGVKFARSSRFLGTTVANKPGLAGESTE